MKQKVDSIVISNEKLQEFLSHINQKSLSVKSDQKVVAIRAFYFDLNAAIETHENWSVGITSFTYLDLKLGYDAEDTCEDTNLDFCLGAALCHVLSIENTLNYAFSWGIYSDVINQNIKEGFVAWDDAYCNVLDLAGLLDKALTFVDAVVQTKLGAVLCEIKKPLDELVQYVEDDIENLVGFSYWWDNGQAWTKQLRDTIIKHRNIGHNWQLSDEQKELLRQYCNANELLVDCLNSGCAVSSKVREEIEETLLL